MIQYRRAGQFSRLAGISESKLNPVLTTPVGRLCAVFFLLSASNASHCARALCFDGSPDAGLPSFPVVISGGSSSPFGGAGGSAFCG